MSTLAATAALTAGCSEFEKPADAPLANVVYVQALDGDSHTNKDDADLLNDWRRDNVSLRIVAFTGILNYRGDNRGYELVVVPGENDDEQFDYISADDGIGGTITDASAEIQEWVDSHSDRDLISVTAINADQGGAQGYIILSVPDSK